MFREAPTFMVICALTLSPVPSSYQPTQPFSSGQFAQIQDELEGKLTTYELIKIDPHQVSSEVRKSGRFSITTRKETLEVVLAVHDMRAPNYRAVKVGSSRAGETVVVKPFRTFKGILINSVDSQARFTIDEGLVEGLILRDGKRYRLDPARKFARSATPSDFVFYETSNVIEQESHVCSVTQNQAAKIPRTDTSEAFSPQRVVELATEADNEYVNALGGPANAINEILSILNQVEGVYEMELGISFEITFQNVWDTAADPYSSTSDSIQLLNEFANHWNSNFMNVSRDLTHLWTGKNMGGVLGRAHQSVACIFPSLSYGLSRVDDRVPLKYNTPAHEIGHNLGATHADGIPECVGSIMRPTTTSGLSFCEYSRSEITQYVTQAGHCLEAVAPGVISGQVTNLNGQPISGVRIDLSGPQSRTTETDSNGNYAFNNLSPESSYSLRPSKPGHSFTPETLTFSDLRQNQVGHFTVTSSPDGPLLAAELVGNRAVALDSVAFLRDPFALFNANSLSADRRTRILLFAVNATLKAGESLAVVSAQAQDPLGNIHNLPVEALERVPEFPWLAQITVKLPDELGNAGNVLVSINVRGQSSNRVLVQIR